jgi:chitinase
MHFFMPLSLLLIAACEVFAGYDATSNKNVAVYWGQNSAGHENGDINLQQRLSYYCNSKSNVRAELNFAGSQ